MTPTRLTILLQDFLQTRSNTEQLTEGLSAEDMVMQSMPDASPGKWHLAHTSWFFEEFVLGKFAPDYSSFDPQFRYLFNSYYEAVGQRHQRPLRGMLTRPDLQTILQYRAHITEQIEQLLSNNTAATNNLLDLIELGIHHEMQHQELLLTDILHGMSLHPFYPEIKPHTTTTATPNIELSFKRYEGGLAELGAQQNGFYYDCEAPRHHHYLEPFQLANRLITNREWLQFMEDQAYQTPTLWLSDGWACVKQEQWQAPLYWVQHDTQWHQYGLDGLRPLNPNAPVCHISYFEADAFAHWAGCRLPREQEWEVVATEQPIKGNLLNQQHWRPQPLATNSSSPQQLYGDVWEWTQSTYSPYPGFCAAEGAVGEYNGKFMCGQFVLRGGSCVTMPLQLRPTYRNFFYPHQRWQFSGLRLAKDA